MAARKYRQKRLDRIAELEQALADMTGDRDDLRLKLVRREAEVDALREMLGKKEDQTPTRSRALGRTEPVWDASAAIDILYTLRLLSFSSLMSSSGHLGARFPNPPGQITTSSRHDTNIYQCRNDSF
ncbi:hypothetical protein AUP68_15982 [Ilyonectria robusta]